MNNCYSILLLLLFFLPLQAMDQQQHLQKQTDKCHQIKEKNRKIQHAITQLRSHREELIKALTVHKQAKLHGNVIKNYISIGSRISLGVGVWLLLKEIIKLKNCKRINYGQLKLATLYVILGIGLS